MTEKTLRSSIALGAAAALVAGGFAAAPAYGAETLTLAPSAGTLYTSVTTSEFEVSAGFSGSESSAATGTLKYRVVNSGTVAITVDTVEGASEAAAAAVVDTGTSDDALDSGQTTNADDFVVDPTGTPEIGAEQSLQLLPTTHTADVTVTVQAFLDLDGGNDIDSNEPTSPVRTITWYDQANISLGSITYDGVTLGSAAFDVVVTTSPALNYQQVASGDFDVQATLAGTDDSNGTDAVAYSSANKDFRATVGLAENVGAVKAVGVQLELTNGSANVDIGSPVYYGAVASGVASAVTAVTAVAGDSFYSSNKLRAGSGTVTLEATVTVGASESVVQPVTFVLEEDSANSLDSGATITVNGETLKNTSSASKQKISVTVNAAATSVATKGKASITVSYSGLKDGNIVDARATVKSASATITSSADLALTGEDSVVTALVDNVTGAARAVMGSSMSINYTVVDQFGVTPAAAEGEFRILVSENSSSANFSQTIAVTNGSATFTTTENSTAANNYVVTGTLQEKVVGGSSFGAIAGGAITETTNVAAVKSDTASSITIAATDDGIADASAVALFLKDQQGTADSEVEQSSIAFETYTGTNLDGTVYGANGAPLAGASVTLSANGLQFVYSKSDAGKVYGADSITVTTDTDGTYTVLVSSNQSGKQTITATSGSATKTEVVEFAAAATSTGAEWIVTAPAYALPGQTFKVTAKLVDAYGNPVGVDTGATSDTEAILTTYSGPGIVFGTLPDETSATGEASYSVLLGANDTGSATMTFGYSLNADSDATDFGEQLATVTVTVGEAPVAQKVNAGSFKGYVAVYARGYEGQRLSAKIGNDWVIVDPIVNNQENGTLHRTVDFTGAGVDITVRIYIDRVLTATIPLTTK